MGQAPSPIKGALDKLYQYDETVEIRQRCEERFQQFCRAQGETLNQFVLRHQQMMAKMREVDFVLPDPLVWACGHDAAKANISPGRIRSNFVIQTVPHTTQANFF